MKGYRPPKRKSIIDLHPDRFKSLMPNIANKKWRINNLYTVVDQDGKEYPFEMNEVQKLLFKNMNNRNVILKSRQVGITTFVALMFLDEILFYPNSAAYIIADKDENAEQIYQTKILHPFVKMDKSIKKMLEIKEENNNKRFLNLNNFSSIRVSMSARSGTAQLLHISEYGIISARDPEKANEIKTGALNTAHKDATIFIESTSKGKKGPFYPLCINSMKITEQENAGRISLNKMQYRFHFFSWIQNKSNDMTKKESESVVLTNDIKEYFDRLVRDKKISTTPTKKAWYQLKFSEMSSSSDIDGKGEFGDQEQVEDPNELMRQEYPTYPEECFSDSVMGSYFQIQLSIAHKRGRMGMNDLYLPYKKVDTWWDLGVSDYMVILFTQTQDNQCYVIDYYESSGKTIDYYIRHLNTLSKDKGYSYGSIVFPHDGGNRDKVSGMSCYDKAREMGYKAVVCVRPRNKQNVINNARNFISHCHFSKNDNVSAFLQHLYAYSKKYIPATGVYDDKPRRSKHNHAADAFQLCAANFSRFSNNSLYLNNEKNMRRVYPQDYQRTAAGLERYRGLA